MRTNCLDSLDRTNVVQSKIAWRVLKYQLGHHGIEAEKQYLDNSQILSESFRNLWVENGNSLSVLYSGTESTTAGITKDGKEGFLSSIASRLNSMNRFIKNNFADDHKQLCIECLLGEGKFHRGNENFEGKGGSTLKVLIATWNLAGIKINADIDLSQWIGKAESP